MKTMKAQLFLFCFFRIYYYKRKTTFRFFTAVPAAPAILAFALINAWIL